MAESVGIAASVLTFLICAHKCGKHVRRGTHPEHVQMLLNRARLQAYQIQQLTCLINQHGIFPDIFLETLEDCHCEIDKSTRCLGRLVVDKGDGGVTKAKKCLKFWFREHELANESSSIEDTLDRLRKNVKDTINANGIPRSLRSDSLNTLQILHDSAVRFEDEGNLKEAIHLHRQVLALKESRFGRHAIETLRTINALGVCFQTFEHHHHANALISEAYQAVKNRKTQYEIDFLKISSNFANVLFYKGKYDAARSMYTQCLERETVLLGPSHKQTIRNRSNIAAIDHRQGHLGDAERQFRRTAAYFEQELGVDHPETIKALMNVAKVLRDGRRYKESELWMREALSHARRRFSDYERVVVNIFHSLSVLLLYLNQTLAALKYALRVKEARTTSFGVADPRTQETVRYVEFLKDIQQQKTWV